MTRTNPSRWDRTTPDLFFGRDTLLHEIGVGLLKGASFGLTGGRRMGKTTFLRKLEGDLRRQAFGAPQDGLSVLIVYLDLHAVPPPLSPDAIYDVVLAQVRRALPATATPSAPEPLHPFAQELARHLAGSESRPQVVVLFDEIQPLVTADWGPGFLANWRSFLHNEPAVDPYLSAVFAGSQELDYLRHELGSPLANILTWKGLRVFDQASTARLVREPSGLGAAVDDVTVGRIHESTGGHPFLIQYFMHRVLAEPGTEISEIVADSERRFLEEHADKFRAWWDRFDERARRLYAALVDVPEGLVRSAAADLIGVQQADRAIELLCHTGVALDEPREIVRAVGTLFRAWFDEHGRGDLMPPSWQEVDRLLYRLERELRDLISSDLAARDGTRWFEALGKRHPALRDKLERAARRPLVSHPAPLEFSDLGELFDLVAAEWATLGRLFEDLAADKAKQKTLLDERKTVLVRTRNTIRHGRSHELDDVQLAKARAYALELIRLVSGRA